MSRAGDSDAAGALRRVTGITLVGGKYVYVRGLGERYSSTLLNGSSLPSPEPERRVVPLDMFPVSILESVVIQKTYSADLPGDFGGGTVMLRTRAFPGSFVANLSLSLGYLVGTSFERVLRYKGGKTDWLGIDDGTRALPPAVRRASKDQILAERSMFSDKGYTAEELAELGRKMPLIFSLSRRRALPDMGLNFTIGDTFRVLGKKAGYFFALTYDNAWQNRHTRLQFTKLVVVGAEHTHAYDVERLENEITLSGIFVTGIDLAEGHRLRLTSLVNRISSNTSRFYQGYNSDLDGDIRVTRLRWEERMLTLHQLRGEHALPIPGKERSKSAARARAHALGLKLDLGWRYAFSMATRGEPDRRDYRYDLERPDRDLWLVSNRPEGNERFYSDLVDYNHDAGLDLRARLKPWLGLGMNLRAGASLMSKTRQVDTRRYYFNDKGPRARDEAVRAMPLEEAFAPELIAPDGWQLEEFTRPTDNYTATHRVWAAYLQADVPLWKDLDLVAGLRVEGSRQEVTTFALFSPDLIPDSALLDDTDPLPALGLTYRFFRKMVLRAYYARTVNRPDFRELSTATFNDITGGRQVFGNPDLKRATIDNVDLRWEWYPRTGVNLSVAAFYKNLHNPIETVVIPSAQLSVTYENATGATNMGLEITGRTDLSFIHRRLRDLYFEGNLAFIHSRVDLSGNVGIQTSSDRPLQGQSPYVINLRLGYENADTGTSALILYNVFGPRIAEVGAIGAPDVLEQPFHQLDITFQQRLGRGFSLTLRARNLIDHSIRLTQAHLAIEAHRRGRSFTLGLQKKW